MTITALGTGSCYCLRNFHSNFLVSRRDLKERKYLLVDCGSDIRMSLAALDLTIADLDAVYITHCHPDHAGGLAYLAYQSISRTHRRKITLYGTPSMMQELWRMLEPACALFGGTECTLSSYFHLVMIPVGEAALWDGLVMTVKPWIHVVGRDNFRTERAKATQLMYSFGLTIHDPYNLVTAHVTGDMQDSQLDYVDDFIKKEKINLMLLDCHTGKPYPGPAVHPTFDSIATLSTDSKRVIRLVHYGDDVLANWEGGHPVVHLIWSNKAHEAGLRFMNVHDVYDTAVIRGQLDAAKLATTDTNNQRGEE